MVEKIDRPEAPAPWRIKETDRTKDGRPSQQQQETPERKKEKFEKQPAEGRWLKFDGRTMIIKPIRVALKDIKDFRFRSVTMHGGVATLEGDLDWANGRTTENAVIRIGGFEEYLRAKKIGKGESVPRDIWAKSDPLDVGIPQEKTPSGSFVMAEIEREAESFESFREPEKSAWLAAVGLKNKTTGKFQWHVLVLYLIIATGLALAVHSLLTMTRT